MRSCWLHRCWQHAKAGEYLHLDPLPLLGSMIGVTQHIGLGGELDRGLHRAVPRGPRLRDARSPVVRPHRLDRAHVRHRAAAAAHRQPQRSRRSSGVLRAAGEFIDGGQAALGQLGGRGFALDKATGMFADPDHVHPINHAGRVLRRARPVERAAAAAGQCRCSCSIRGRRSAGTLPWPAPMSADIMPHCDGGRTLPRMHALARLRTSARRHAIHSRAANMMLCWGKPRLRQRSAAELDGFVAAHRTVRSASSARPSG